MIRIKRLCMLMLICCQKCESCTLSVFAVVLMLSKQKSLRVRTKAACTFTHKHTHLEEGGQTKVGGLQLRLWCLVGQQEVLCVCEVRSDHSCV